MPGAGAVHHINGGFMHCSKTQPIRSLRQQLRAASGKWRFVVGSTYPIRWTSMSAAATIRQRCWPKLRSTHQGLRPPPNLALAGENGGLPSRGAITAFSTLVSPHSGQEISPAFCCASNPSPSRNHPSNWWPRPQRSVNKIIDTTSEPCGVFDSSRYLQSAAANAREHAIASVLNGPLRLGQPLFTANQAKWSCARSRGWQWPACSPAARLRICRVCAIDRDTTALAAFAGPCCEVRRIDLETDDGRQLGE